MAEMFKWYASEDAKGFPGMKADATSDVIDSMFAEGGINPGDVVVRGTNAGQVKAAAAAADGKNGIGIAVHVHREQTGAASYYETGYTVPVMTFGDIYVKAGGDVVAGGKADITVTDGETLFVATGGTNTVPNVTFLDSGAKGDIVRVRIRN